MLIIFFLLYLFLLCSWYNAVYLIEHVFRLFIVFTILIKININGFDSFKQELNVLFCFDKEICLNAAWVLFFGGLHNLLLDNLKFNLHQIEQRLYSLLIFCECIILRILTIIFDIWLRKLLHQIVNHYLVLDGLLIIINLQEIVSNLLVNVDFFFEVITEFDRSHLILDCFFEVFKAL